LEEPTGRCRIAPRGHEHVDDLPELVDCPIDVAPLARDLDIGLIDLPAVADRMAAGPGGLGQQRREPQHPPVDGDVIDVHAASVSSSSTSRYDNAKRRYQRTASTITSGREAEAAKADRGMVAGRGRWVLMTTVCPLGARSQQMQQRQNSTYTAAETPCRW
jgi:hypothetical protein